jgi:hypothetical protein
MRATPFEMLLVNLRQQMPDPMYQMSRATAYEKLKTLTGQDFGYDFRLWEEWGFKNEMFMTPPRFLKYLSNFREELPEYALYFLPREEAYAKLKEFSGRDFGYDDKRWEQWGRENGHFR